jgi:hypothetical protein
MAPLDGRVILVTGAAGATAGALHASKPNPSEATAITDTKPATLKREKLSWRMKRSSSGRAGRPGKPGLEHYLAKWPSHKERPREFRSFSLDRFFAPAASIIML